MEISFDASQTPSDALVLLEVRRAGPLLKSLEVPDATELTDAVVVALAGCTALEELILGTPDFETPGAVSGAALCEHLPTCITRLDVSGCNLRCGDLVELRKRLTKLEEDELNHCCDRCDHHPSEPRWPARTIPPGCSEEQREEFVYASCRACSNEACGARTCDDCAEPCCCEFCGAILCMECNPGHELGWFQCDWGSLHVDSCGKTCCGDCVGRPGRYENNGFGLCQNCAEGVASDDDEEGM